MSVVSLSIDVDEDRSPTIVLDGKTYRLLSYELKKEISPAEVTSPFSGLRTFEPGKVLILSIVAEIYMGDT